MTRPNARRLAAPAAVLLALLVPATAVAISNDWTRHMGTKADDVAGGIAADGSGLTIVGTTGGHLTHKVGRQRRVHPALRPRRAGAVDAPVRHRRPGHGAGRRRGRRRPHRARLDRRRVRGRRNPRRRRPVLRRYDRNGDKLWTRQFGTSKDEDPGAIAAGDGGLFVAGMTAGALAGTNAPDDPDAFVRRYDRAGHVEWTRQFGTNDGDSAGAVDVDGAA